MALYVLPTTLLLLLLLVLFLPILFLIFSTKRKLKLPPGPPQLPVIGNLHQLSGDLPHRTFHDLAQTHGPLMHLKLGGTPVVVASSSETAREFLKVHDSRCCSRPKLTAFGKFSFGHNDIAFAPYGEQWRELRKTCTLHFFSARKVASFRAVREEEVERMTSAISSRAPGEVFNLSDEVLALSNNITCRTAIGMRYSGGGDEGRLDRLLKEAEETAGAMYFADLAPMLGWVDVLTGRRGRIDECVRELVEFYEEVIEEHKKDPDRRNGRVEDALDALLAMQKEAPHLITDNHVMGVLMNIFIAGTDTSSSVIEWAMTELLRNPPEMRKAQDEVRGTVGTKEKVEECDVEHLHYLKLVIKETLRLHPPVPLLLPREVMEDCDVNGYDIPAGTRLFINAWAIGRDPNTWERPNDFLPKRFLDSSIDFRGQDFEFIPFGAGRRICPGMHSGNLVVELALANLLYQFDWEVPMKISIETIDTEEAPGVTVHKKHPLRLVARPYLR